MNCPADMLALGAFLGKVIFTTQVDAATFAPHQVFTISPCSPASATGI